MKIQKNTKRTRRILPTIILLVFLAGTGYGIYAVLNSDDPSSNSSEINYSEPTNEQVDAGEDAKRQTVNEDQERKDDPKFNSQNENLAQTPTVRLTAASVEGDVLYIRSEIDGIYNEGLCKLSLTKSGTSVTKSAGIQALPKSSTCKGFNIPTTELSKGNWSIHLSVTISGSTTRTTGNVEV